MNHLVGIAEKFNLPGKVHDIKEFGNGNLNHTFLVTLDSPGTPRDLPNPISRRDPGHVILQSINTRVFRHPELIMQNMRAVTEHVHQKLQQGFIKDGRRWELPRVLLTNDSRDHWPAPDGSFWRAITFIENSESLEVMKDANHAREVGWALGMFHSIISDLPAETLADTLVGFHITPRYLQQYDEILGKVSVHHSSAAEHCRRFIADRRAWAGILEDAKHNGRLALRPIHGDPKINNIMMDPVSGQAVSFVDLDTVKPGLIHYDIGDCLRSGCNPLGEETTDFQNVRFEGGLCSSLLEGYLAVAREFLSANDYEYLYDAVRLITFELGLRFFTDYLAGNVYFKARHPNHNLDRAMVQFKLCESIEAQETSIRRLIGKMA